MYDGQHNSRLCKFNIDFDILPAVWISTFSYMDFVDFNFSSKWW